MRQPCGRPGTRHIFPRRPGYFTRPSLCCCSFCAPAATPQFRLPRCAAPTAQHQTDTIRETGGYLKKTTRSSREFFSRPSTHNTLQLSRGLSASFVLPQLKRIRFFQRKPLGALENFFQPPAQELSKKKFQPPAQCLRLTTPFATRRGFCSLSSSFNGSAVLILSKKFEYCIKPISSFSYRLN